MKTKLFLVLVAIVNTFISVKAQSSFGVFAEGGASKAKISVPDDVDNASLKLTTYYLPSAQAGIYYDCLLKDKFILGANLFVTTVASKADFYWEWDPAMPNSSWQEGTIEGRLLGIGLEPLHIGYKYKKFSLRAGVQAAAFLAYNYHNKYTEYYYDGINGTDLHQNTYEEKGKGNGGAFDLGITAGIAYHINKRFTAEADNYFDIYNTYSPNVKLLQLNIGIKYAIFVSKKKETKTTEQ